MFGKLVNIEKPSISVFNLYLLIYFSFMENFAKVIEISIFRIWFNLTPLKSEVNKDVLKVKHASLLSADIKNARILSKSVSRWRP